MANSSENIRPKTGLTPISPVRKTGLGLILAAFSIFSLISLIDYDPSNYHTYPPNGESPLMGQAGVIAGRYMFALLGLSAWLLPWVFGLSAWQCLTPTTKRVKIRKILPLFFVILSICLLANIKDPSMPTNL